VTTQAVSVSIFGTADAPVLTLPSNSVETFGGSISLTGAHVSDADMGDSITLNLSVAHGSLAPNVDPTTLGITIDDGNGTDGTLQVHGPTAAIDTLLSDGVTYTPNAGSPEDLLIVHVRDSEGLTASQQLTITNHTDTVVDIADGTLAGTASSDQIVISPSGSNDAGALTSSPGNGAVDWHFSASNNALVQQEGQTQFYSIQDQTNPAASQSFSVSIGGPGQDTFTFNPGNSTNLLVNFSAQTDAAGHYLGDAVTLNNFTNGQGNELTLSDILNDLTTDSHGNALVNLGHGDSVVFEHVSQSVVQAQAGNLLHITNIINAA
jgi:hypothetical protein